MGCKIVKFLNICILLLAMVSCRNREKHFIYSHGAVVRGDTTSKEIALVFTGDEFGDGGKYIAEILEKENIKASFFLTGNFYRNKEFEHVLKELLKNGNYLGSHSDRHLLYCDWEKRDSLLVSKKDFVNDLSNSYSEMAKYGISRAEAVYFLPPYEWYNDSIALWTNQSGLKLVNFTGGTRSNADYTYPGMGNQYTDSNTIYDSIISYEQRSVSGLNGFILLIHIGTDPRRMDKFYYYLPELVKELKSKGYKFVRIDELMMSQKGHILSSWFFNPNPIPSP
jgi:peptidoglycan/xylan/chitin deacetylase (PgdA/CDA1 family)